MALLPLLIALGRLPRSFERPRPFRAFTLGLVTGVTYFTGTLYWLTDVMVTFGGLAWPLALLAAALLIAYLSLFPALFSVIVAYMRRQLGPEALLLAPAVWVATELGRGYFLTGFPWVPLGNSQVSVLPIAQVASLIGVYGLSVLVAAPAACAAYVFYRRGRVRWLPLGTVAALLIGVTVWGNARLAANDLLREGSPLKVGIVQGNIAQRTKWDPAWRDRILTSYLQMSYQAAEKGVSLIVWPEASMPFLFNEDPQRAQAMRRLAQDTGAFILTGGDEVDRGGALAAGAPATNGGGQAPIPDRWYNSAFLLRPDGGVAGTYRKMQLVPFGEYVPFKNVFYFVGPIIEAVDSFSAGERVVVLPVGPRGLSTGICYEVVFPHLARAAVLNGSQLLTTITNDAWYGTSSAPFQHFEQARMRAIENGRYLVRSANTGISGVVDPYGRVVARTELFVPAVSTVDVRFLEGWTLYARIGDVLAYACVALTALALLASLRGQPSRV